MDLSGIRKAKIVKGTRQLLSVKEEILNWLDKGIKVLENRKNLELNKREGTNIPVNEIWGGIDENGVYPIRIMCRGKNVYLDKDMYNSGEKFIGSNQKELLATCKSIRKQVEGENNVECYYKKVIKEVKRDIYDNIVKTNSGKNSMVVVSEKMITLV